MFKETRTYTRSLSLSLCFCDSETARNDPCETSFAVERALVAAQKVYAFLGKPENIHVQWRQGQHHGFEMIQNYFDLFDVALGRGKLQRSDFPQVWRHVKHSLDTHACVSV